MRAEETSSIVDDAPTRERFAQWLQDSGWDASQIEEVDLVFEAGLVWPMKTHAAV